MKENELFKKFENIMRSFSGWVSKWKIFNDFLYLSAISMANTVPVPEREEREKYYLSLINQYEKKEQELFAQLLSVLVLALDENPEQDFLGAMYHRLELQQEQKGQFFRPYHICEFMSKILYDKEAVKAEIKQKGYISVSDPACGAGAMLVAFANAVREEGINYQQQVLFVAQDIDQTTALMCFLQLSLLGCPAIIIVGDTLAKPGMHQDNDIWYTPFYYLNSWRFQANAEVQGEESECKSVIQVTSNPEYLEDTEGQMAFCLEEMLKEAS